MNDIPCVFNVQHGLYKIYCVHSYPMKTNVIKYKYKYTLLQQDVSGSVETNLRLVQKGWERLVYHNFKYFVSYITYKAIMKLTINC